jgi:uncharacterized protein (DUF1697 family)
MPRYVAFLRGVSPLNAKMPDLKRCFEAAGFSEVRTLLSSGNVVFSSRVAKEARLARRAEEAMQAELGRSFGTIIRTTSHLQTLLAAQPFAEFSLPPQAKRVITFLRTPPAGEVELPVERDGARVLKVVGTEVLCAYVPGPKGPVFMSVLERTFGKDITTRTVDTVSKCAEA